jgi:hypothetical protein
VEGALTAAGAGVAAGADAVLPRGDRHPGGITVGLAQGQRFPAVAFQIETQNTYELLA